jgi:hypothetical protein
MNLLVSSRLQNTKELSDRVFGSETEKQFLQLANDFHVLGSTAELSVLQKCIISQQISM